MTDIANLKRAKHFARMDYERQMASAGSSGGSFSECGPPSWNRQAWEAFKSQYGSYPFGPQFEGGYIYPSSFEGAPDWVYVLMGMRKPPVSVTLGSGGASYAGADELAVWGIR